MALQYYELRSYQLRNGYMKSPAPSCKIGGAGPIGLFHSVIGENAPFLLTLQTWSSFQEAEQSDQDVDFDYLSYDRTLLRAFTGMPEMRLPPPSNTSRVFELRTYHSNTAATLRKKIAMFNDGEIGIFQRVGMNPVFFGEALVGGRLPHLTYMLAHEDMAAGERAWKAFLTDPEWMALKETPGLSDAEIVSNISTAILRPSPLSDIR